MEKGRNLWGSTQIRKGPKHLATLTEMDNNFLIKSNNTLKALEILLKLDHIVKGNNIAEVWVGRCTNDEPVSVKIVRGNAIEVHLVS